MRNAVLQEVDPSNEIRIVRLAGLEASTFTHNEPAPSLIIVRHQKSSIEFPADTDIHCIARLLKELNS
ncbi:MAG: hypothetical protein J5603_05205 [Bacteroidales bacterium]|nr:hypothetical protein [Bacteroidales bacterium]